MEKIVLHEDVYHEVFGVKLDLEKTSFRLLAPNAKKVDVCIYEHHQDIRRTILPMVASATGSWYAHVEKNLEGKYYTFLLDNKFEIIDPYAHSSSGNTTKGCILDAKQINPSGFLEHKKPSKILATESIIYEIHVKDFSHDPKANFKNKGKFLAFTEKGLTYQGQKIGLDHLIELGITHVHLLPVYDFISVNEYDKNDYNWGYDPYLFNGIEGSYASSLEEGKTRILELKQLIQSLHEANIRVVLDVVYNHTFFCESSNFNRLLPGIFYRTDENHNFSNGSGCGCELQTEHPFVRKFIVDSLKFWLETYQVDGFRFDLMALYDIETIQAIEKTLEKIKPDILLYGEPWTGGTSQLDEALQYKKGKQQGSSIALFNDTFRNNIKGDNDGTGRGFVGSLNFHKNEVYSGCLGSVHFSNSVIGFTKKASETVNYVSSHDNLILWDKFEKAYGHMDFESLQNMNALALSMVILSFGIPFIQGGTEFLRTKQGHHNSYNVNPGLNQITWANKKEHRHVFDFIKNLIEFRKSQKVFALIKAEDIKAATRIIGTEEHVVMYELSSPFEKDFKKIRIVYNGKLDHAQIDLGSDAYEVIIDGALFYNENVKIEGQILHIPKVSVGVCVIK